MQRLPIDWQSAVPAGTSVGFAGVSLSTVHQLLQIGSAIVAIVAGCLAIAVSLRKLWK